MTTRFRRLGLAAALAVAVAAIAAGGALADQSYTDAGGDAGPGTDVTAITVRNDQAGGITIQVGSASPVVANHAIAVFLNTDRNAATGGQGDEYWMFSGPLVGSRFFTWVGSGFALTSPASFSAGTAGTNVTEFRFNRADIGNVTRSGIRDARRRRCHRKRCAPYSPGCERRAWAGARLAGDSRSRELSLPVRRNGAGRDSGSQLLRAHRILVGRPAGVARFSAVRRADAGARGDATLLRSPFGCG